MADRVAQDKAAEEARLATALAGVRREAEARKAAERSAAAEAAAARRVAFEKHFKNAIISVELDEGDEAFLEQLAQQAAAEGQPWDAEEEHEQVKAFKAEKKAEEVRIAAEKAAALERAAAAEGRGCA